MKTNQLNEPLNLQPNTIESNNFFKKEIKKGCIKIKSTMMTRVVHKKQNINSLSTENKFGSLELSQ